MFTSAYLNVFLTANLNVYLNVYLKLNVLNMYLNTRNKSNTINNIKIECLFEYISECELEYTFEFVFNNCTVKEHGYELLVE